MGVIRKPNALVAAPNEAIVRFCKRVKVKRCGCWEWQGHTDRKGYGQFWMEDRAHWAHRVAFYLFVGEIPRGLTVHHKCCNASCVNPDHLDLLTRGQNAAEANSRRKCECEG